MGKRRAQIKIERQASIAASEVHLDTLDQTGLGFNRDGIAGVKGLDCGDLFVCPIALGRLVGESQAVGKQHRVLSHILTGVEILGKQARRHHQGRADVREALAGGAVDRELAGRVERGDARQVLDRVGVFRI